MFCENVPLILQVQQRPVVMVAAQDDAATLAAVTTVRTSVGVILNMAEMHGSPSALA
jgi:hypothetical protein